MREKMTKHNNDRSTSSTQGAESKLVRLQKILADAGVASRRAAEELILDGRVYVNGNQIITLGSKFDPEKIELEVDGESINLKQSKAYLMFYKPQGVLSAMSDSEGRENLGDYFSKKGKFSQLIRQGNERFFHVGRLDLESEGLLLLTNDGEMAHRATHPSYGVEKKYLVLVHGEFSISEIEKWKKGVELEDGFIRVSEANLWRSINNKDHWISITIHEGRYHIIRRLCESSGLRVDRLIRTDFGPISIGELKEGRYRHLIEGEVESLFKVLKLNQ